MRLWLSNPIYFLTAVARRPIEFYKKALGAEVLMMMRYKESPEPHAAGMVPPGWENKIMHASLRIGNANGDGLRRLQRRDNDFQGFSYRSPAANEAERERKFAALAEGGQVQMPLGKTFWSPCFGMVADRFGVGWMVTVAP